MNYLSTAPFFKDLMPASWRGVPFGVTSNTYTTGRKVAIHEFPYVDGVYVEDLGRKGKRFHFIGFLVEGGGAYGGFGTLKQQIEQFDSVISQSGNGVLVHPTLGMKSKIALIEYECEQDEKGGVATIKLTLIENAVQPMATSQPNTQVNTLNNANLATQATLLDGLVALQGVVRTEVNGITGMVNLFTTQINQIAFTATSLVSMVANLPGEVGRYIGSSVLTVNKDINATISDLIGLGSVNLANVLDNIQSLNTSADNVDLNGIASGINNTVTAIYQANPDPAQAITTLSVLLNLQQLPTTGVAAQGWNTINDLIRRSAVICMAQASANRQFISYDDAQETRTLVCSAIDDEMLIAGDQGLDNTYDALRDLKISVSQDITLRGASLAKVIQVSSMLPVSSLVWAQRLYQDSGRDDELVKEANPIHPAFMPISFKALAS